MIARRIWCFWMVGSSSLIGWMVKAAIFLPAIAGAGVEDGGEAESLGVEALVGHEGAAEVAGADEQDVPDLVGAEDALDLGDEVVDAVADAGVAELAEVGEVLADLGIGEVEGFAELLGGDGSAVLALEGFELAEVEARVGGRRGWGWAPAGRIGRVGYAPSCLMLVRITKTTTCTRGEEFAPRGLPVRPITATVTAELYHQIGAAGKNGRVKTARLGRLCEKYRAGRRGTALAMPWRGPKCAPGQGQFLTLPRAFATVRARPLVLRKTRAAKQL